MKLADLAFEHMLGLLIGTALVICALALFAWVVLCAPRAPLDTPERREVGSR